MMECKPLHLEKKAQIHEAPGTPSVHPSSTHIYAFRVGRLLLPQAGSPSQTWGEYIKTTQGAPNPEASAVR